MAKYLLVAMMLAALAACGPQTTETATDEARVESRVRAQCVEHGLNPDCSPRSEEPETPPDASPADSSPAETSTEDPAAATAFPATYDLHRASCSPPPGARPCVNVAILNDDITPERACVYMHQVVAGICAPADGATPLEAEGVLTGTPDGDIRYRTARR